MTHVGFQFTKKIDEINEIWRSGLPNYSIAQFTVPEPLAYALEFCMIMAIGKLGLLRPS